MIIVIINILDLILHCFEKDIYMRSPQYSVPTTLALVISSLLTLTPLLKNQNKIPKR
nr:Uncharacterised protein [Klebsiella pneumoniae]